MKKLLSPILFLAFLGFGFAQENLGYQQPPSEIKELVDVPLAPAVVIDSKAEQVVLLYRDPFKSIAELSEKELRLGGLRINPITNIGSRTTYYNNIKVKTTKERDPREVQGLPTEGRFSNFRVAPDEKTMAFLNTLSDRVELWVLDISEGIAKKLETRPINANLGFAINWFADSKSLLIKTVPHDRKDLIDVSQAIPDGPTITVSDGEKAQNRTYQDLLANTSDEYNFEQLARAEIIKVALDGSTQNFLPADMYRAINFSPDGNYVMVTQIKKPFSYIVPYSRFPYETHIYDTAGNRISTVNDVPLNEVLPKGFMAVQTGKRNLDWRADKPATLYWVEALDQGDPEVDVTHRDAVYQLTAPFTGQPELLLKTTQRFSGITWGNDNTAIAHDYWWNTRNTKSYIFNPSNNTQTPKIIFDRNYQDRYSDPGDFVSVRNEYNRRVLALDKNNAFLIGDGFSDKGQFPFIDEIDLATLQSKRLYESRYTDKVEDLQSVIDIKKGQVLIRLESQTDYPNYYIRDIRKKEKLSPITYFDNPFKSMAGVHKEVISYTRKDGLELDGTLYLPVGYDKDKKEKMPMILWAYPREYKDKSSASQSTSNPNKFIYPFWGSPVYWVTRGYVVLDNAAFPIVGEGDDEPNDTFRTQLVANAAAAIDAVDRLGYIDRNRVGVGGHSYGAFMVANLLSHSNLFAAGIARSGAYNRTLTPFGFQSEERSYWDSPETYNDMSPFMHADKMKTPLLLIHGEDDNNSGTYPMQSERYFNALKGLGAPTRLVMLPKESHGYSAKESILHMLWEQDQWLETYVKQKNKKD